VFGQVNGSLVAMNFFSHPLLFSLLGLGIPIEPLKIQLCPPVYICFEFDPHFFLFLFVLILMLLEVFFFNFIHQHLVSFNFCIQYGPYSFD
jgi:hypothetical protein